MAFTKDDFLNTTTLFDFDELRRAHLEDLAMSEDYAEISHNEIDGVVFDAWESWARATGVLGHRAALERVEREEFEE